MKKTFIFIFSLLLIFCTGCTSKFEPVKLTNEEKIELLSEISLPSEKLIKTSISVDLTVTGEEAGHVRGNVTSFINLTDKESFYQYAKGNVDIDADGVFIKGDVGLYIDNQYSYLDINAKTKRNSSEIAIKSKEKMDTSAIINFEEIETALNMIINQDFLNGDILEITDSIEKFLDKMDVTQNKESQIITILFGKEDLADTLAQFTGAITNDEMEEILSYFSNDSEIKFVMKVDKKELVSISLDVNVKANIKEQDQEINLKASIEVKMYAKEPLIPSNLEEYEEVAYFSIINYLS